MTKRRSLCFLYAFLSLTGCATPPTEQVMASITYHRPVNFHMAHKAYLNWKVGKQHSSTQSYFTAGSGFMGKIAGKHKSTGRYTYTYGTAQQAVFMRSLRDALDRNHAFTRTDITYDAEQARANDVLMTVYFRNTRVTSHLRSYNILINAELTIKEGRGAVFRRAYKVESNPGGLFAATSFKQQQTEVSELLLNKVMAGIEEWAGQHR